MRILIFLWLISSVFSLPKDDITVRGVKNFYSICQGVAAKIKRDANDKNLVVWLIDATPSLDNEIEQLKGEVSHFYECGIPDLSMAVATVKKNVAFSLDVTTKPASVIRYLDKLQYIKGVNAYKNRLQPLRKVAEKYAAFPGKKSIVYLTLSPWENEDNLEDTLAILQQHNYSLYVVASEAVFSDYYAIENKLKNKQFTFRGSESVADESMWSWITIPSSYYINGQKKNTFFPSGFGFYGLSRLVSQLDGWYYIYTPQQVGSKKSTATGYRYVNLHDYRPQWLSRSEYMKNIRKTNEKLLFRYWDELASSKGISRYHAPFRVSLQISENKKRGAKVTPLLYTLKSPAQIKTAVKTVSAKIGTVRAIKKKITYAMKKVKDQRNRESANLNLLYCNLLKSEFHLQQYLKVIAELNGIRKKLRRQFREKKQVTLSVRVIGNYKQGLSSKAKLSKTETKIVKKMMDQLSHYRSLYGGTPWGYSIETGSILTFTHKIVAIPKPKKSSPKAKSSSSTKPPAPPTRVLINSAGSNSQTSGN